MDGGIRLSLFRSIIYLLLIEINKYKSKYLKNLTTMDRGIWVRFHAKPKIHHTNKVRVKHPKDPDSMSMECGYTV